MGRSEVLSEGVVFGQRHGRGEKAQLAERGDVHAGQRVHQGQVPEAQNNSLVAGAGAASGEQRAMRDQRQSWLEKRAGAGSRRASHRFEFDSKPCRRGRDTFR